MNLQVGQSVRAGQFGPGSVIAINGKRIVVRTNFDGRERTYTPDDIQLPPVQTSSVDTQAEERAARVLLSQKRRDEKLIEREAAKVSKHELRVPSQLLAYVIENWHEIFASPRTDLLAHFEKQWLDLTGLICDQPYSECSNEARWGLTTRIQFLTPPEGMQFGDVRVKPDPRREGYSIICQNDFFWEVVAVVKQLGPRLS